MDHERLRKLIHENYVASLERVANLGRAAAREHIGPWLLRDAGVGIDVLTGAEIVGTGDAVRTLGDVEAWFERRGLRPRLMLRSDADAAVIAAARQRGYTEAGGMPVLVLPLDPPPQWPAPVELSVKPVQNETTLARYGVATRGEGVWADVLPAIARRALTLPGFQLFVGSVTGIPVATAMAVVTGPLVCPYNVSVAPEYRRRGYGRAMTAATVRAGIEAGCTIAALESSAMGLPLYESMGYRHLFRYVELSIAGQPVPGGAHTAR